MFHFLHYIVQVIRLLNFSSFYVYTAFTFIIISQVPTYFLSFLFRFNTRHALQATY